MNRIIKFRAWDADQRRMRNVYGWHLHPDGFMVQFERDNPTPEHHFDWIFSKNPMQFTGLKDKNGKEIYEGDFVRNTKLSLPKVDQIVYAADDYCGFMRKWPNGQLDWIDGTVLEVVGNIHENPELVK